MMKRSLKLIAVSAIAAIGLTIAAAPSQAAQKKENPYAQKKEHPAPAAQKKEAPDAQKKEGPTFIEQLRNRYFGVPLE